MANDNLKTLIAKYCQMGLDSDIIRFMYGASSEAEQKRMVSDENYFFDKYQEFQNQATSTQFPASTGGNTGHISSAAVNAMGMNTEEVNIHKAIEESLKSNVQGSYEPLELESRGRKSGEPVGLKNVGNTCYFNSLMQILFRIEPLVKDIITLDLETIKLPDSDNPQLTKRRKDAIQMVKNLQDLFGNLIASNQKYTDPSPVLNKCVDDMGEQVRIGDQKDIVEYAINFFERIEDVLNIMDHKYTESPVDKLSHSNSFLETQVQSTTTHGAMAEEHHNKNSMFDFDKSKMDVELQRNDSFVSPAKLRTTISVYSTTIIQKLFFGRMVPVIQVDGSEIQGDEEVFGPILLDPSTNYFYKSWEDHFYNKIEGYPGAKQGYAYKWELVKDFPQILCFQINRAKYNVQKQRIEKNNQRFEFEETIYTDRFLLKNKEAIANLRDTARALEEEINSIGQQLNAVSSFNDGRNIQKSLEDVLLLLQTLNSKDESKSLPSVLLQQNIPNFENIVSALGSVKGNIEKESEALESRRKTIETDIKKLYSHLEHSKYTVFAVIIHEGTADSGHYYCYIRMKGEKWIKFNDFHVREANQAEVMETAFGKEGSIASAYCVFYMKNEVYDKYEGHNFGLIADSPDDGYYKFVPQNKLSCAISSNVAFENELKKSYVKKMVNSYVKKIDTAKRNYEELYKDLKGKVIGLRSIGDFFITLSNVGLKEIHNCVELYNYIILQSTIRHFVREKGINGFDLNKFNENYADIQLILEETDKLTVGKKISDLRLDANQHISLAEIVSKYILRVEQLYAVSDMIDAELECRFIEFFSLAALALTNITDREHVRADFSSNFCKEVSQVGILKFLFVLRHICKSRPQDADKLVDSVHAFCKMYPLLGYYKQTISNHLKFTKLALEDILSILPESLASCKADIQHTVTVITNQLGGHTAPYKYLPSVKVISRIKELIEKNRQTLSTDEPNQIEEDIMKRAAKVNKSPKETFSSESFIIELHISLYKGDQSEKYSQIVENITPHMDGVVDKTLAALSTDHAIHPEASKNAIVPEK